MTEQERRVIIEIIDELEDEYPSSKRSLDAIIDKLFDLIQVGPDYQEDGE